MQSPGTNPHDPETARRLLDRPGRRAVQLAAWRQLWDLLLAPMVESQAAGEVQRVSETDPANQ